MRSYGALVLFAMVLLPRLAIAEPAQVDFLDPAVQASAAARPLDRQPRGLADRDGDRLSDSLNAIVDASAPGEPIDVVVTFSVPGPASNMARQAVGSFRVGREFQIIRGFTATMTAAIRVRNPRRVSSARMVPAFLISPAFL